MDEQRYTLVEARLILKREACDNYGHNYDVVSKRLENRPMRVVCTRCNRRWELPDPSTDATQLIPKFDDSTHVLPRVH